MRCVNCIHCIDTIWKEEEIQFYVCQFNEEYNLIEECIANDENMECDFYEQDCHDDFTERT